MTGRRPAEPAPPLQLGPIPAELRDAINPFARAAAPEDSDATEFRVSELSRRSGVSIGTIKYYLREGLLPAGRAVGKTQARYSAEHVQRLRLIRTLREVGGLSLQQIHEVTTALDRPDISPLETTATVAYAVERGRDAASGDEVAGLEQARADSDAFIDALGFNVLPAAPARDQLARALASLRSLGMAAPAVIFTEHAIAAYELARAELAHHQIDAGDDRGPSPEDIAAGIVVFGRAFLALRAIGHEHETRRLLGEPPRGFAP